MTVWQDMQKHLDELAAAELLRRPVEVQSACGARVTVGGRELVCLCSNDYLGLADDPAVKAAAIEAVGLYGVGAGASRLVSGTQSPHAQLERSLAQFKGAPAAVVTSTGWMANQVAVHALAGAGDLILCDKLNHASIIDAALSSGARVRTYPHADVARLADLLATHRAAHRRCLIVTDSLFSMDGDLAPLAELAALKARYDAVLMIDEAHATGVLGEHGRGAAELLGVEEHVDVVVGTLSKALGTLGGFVAGPTVLIDTIRNTGRPYIYTTALPPAICAAAQKSLELVQAQPWRRQGLLEMAAWFGREVSDLLERRKKASQHPDHDDFEQRRQASPATHSGSAAPLVTQIIPILIGEAADSMRVSRALFDAGFLVPAIRPPTVPRGTSRLRVSLAATHQRADLERFLDALGKVLQVR